MQQIALHSTFLNCLFKNHIQVVLHLDFRFLGTKMAFPGFAACMPEIQSVTCRQQRLQLFQRQRAYGIIGDHALGINDHRLRQHR